VALADELGIQRTLLYKWRKKFEADEAIGDPVPVNAGKAGCAMSSVTLSGC